MTTSNAHMRLMTGTPVRAHTGGARAKGVCGGWQALEAENAALAQQLASVGKGAALAESTMRELATLHQMLSTQARAWSSPNLQP